MSEQVQNDGQQPTDDQTSTPASSSDVPPVAVDTVDVPKDDEAPVADDENSAVNVPPEPVAAEAAASQDPQVPAAVQASVTAVEALVERVMATRDGTIIAGILDTYEKNMHGYVIQNKESIQTNQIALYNALMTALRSKDARLLWNYILYRWHQNQSGAFGQELVHRGLAKDWRHGETRCKQLLQLLNVLDLTANPETREAQKRLFKLSVVLDAFNNEPTAQAALHAFYS